MSRHRPGIRFRRVTPGLLASPTLLPATPGTLPTGAAAEYCFVETGHCTDARCCAFWQANGGTRQLG